MVREGFLEHPVHGAHVLGDREPGLVAVHLTHPGALLRRRQRSGSSEGSTGRRMCNQVRTIA